MATGMARGYARMKEIGAESAARSEVLVKELLATLPRQPTPIDRVLAVAIAAATLKLERQLAMGRDTTSARRALVEAIASSPFAPEPAREAAQ